jgi:Uma2 family endonuclease
VTPTRYRIPDVCALTSRPADSRYPDAAQPPLFTTEIVSQGEPWTELRRKITDHLAMSVPLVIIADPSQQNSDGCDPK